MSPEELQQRMDLTEAVNGLLKEVRQLNEKLALYAPREEVRSESRKRAFRFLGMALVIIVIAQLLTMMTISRCFLSISEDRSMYCSLMPGYNEAVAQGEVRIDQFEVLLSTIQQNQEDINRLEAEIKKLREEG